MPDIVLPRSPIQLDPEAFRQLIHSNSQKVRWLPAQKCPCQNAETGRTSRVCPYGCRNGWLFSEQTIYHASDYVAPTAPVTTLAGMGAGLLSNGVYRYKVTYYNSLGETPAGDASSPLTIVDRTSNGKILLSNLPLYHRSAVTGRKIYRTKANGNTFFLVATIPDNETVEYLDTTSDQNLGSRKAPSLNSLIATPAIWQEDITTQTSPTIIKVSQSYIASMPDEMPLASPDMIICMETFFVQEEIKDVTAEGKDELNQLYAQGVRQCRTGDGVSYREGDDFTISVLDNGRSYVNWINLPEEGLGYTIEYFSLPVYWIYGVKIREPRMSVYGSYKLPFRAILSQKAPDVSEE